MITVTSAGMGWIEALTAVFVALIWPITILVLALTFNGEIREILRRITSFNLGPFAGTLGGQIENLAQEVGANSPNSESPSLLREDEGRAPVAKSQDVDRGQIAAHSQHRSIARLRSPRATIQDSWEQIQLALRELADKAFDANGLVNAGGHQIDPNDLVEKGVISQATANLIEEARGIKDRVSHPSGGPVSLAEAALYLVTAEDIANKLQIEGSH